MTTNLSDIKAYYNETQSDYNNAWFTDKTLAIHFGFYDENATTHEEAVLNVNRVMANLVDVKKGERVLDAGCGVGGAALWLAKNKEARVTGISPVAHQIEKGNAKALEMGLSHLADFQELSFLDTQFPNETFDVVWACESVCHAANKDEFYQEAFRILKPGGRLVMAEYMRFQRPMNKKAEKQLLRGLSGWAIKDIDSGKEHFEHAKNIGFRQVIIRDYSKYTRVSLRNLLRHVDRWLWLGKILVSLGLRSKVQHGNLAGSKDICETFLDGHWFYGLLTAQKPG